jgi:hypothetical protein
MRTRSLTAAVLVVGLALGPVSGAVAGDDDDHHDHYEGLPAPSLEAAMKNLGEYNDKLAGLVERRELSPRELEEIHQLTYTLENALHRMQEELATMAEDLEAVHLASEAHDRDTVRARGKAYLSGSSKLVD